MKKKCIVDLGVQKSVLPCDIAMHDKYKWIGQVNALKATWKEMSLILNCIIIKEKETHNRIEALIKNNSEF